MSEETNSERRRFKPEQKYQIVKEALTTDTSVSEICRKYGLAPSLFYQWQEKFLSSALEGFEQSSKSSSTQEAKLAEKVAVLEAKLRRKDEVIAEVTAECIGLKKDLGEL